MVMADDDRFCSKICTLYRLFRAQNTLDKERKLRGFDVGSDHIRCLYGHLLSDNDIQAFISEDVIDIHSYAKSTCFFGKHHLISDLTIIRIGFYDTDSLCSGIYDLLEKVIFHHSDEIKDIHILCRCGVLLQTGQFSSLKLHKMGKSRRHNRTCEVLSKELCRCIGNHRIDQAFLDQDAVHIAGRDLICIRYSCISHRVSPSGDSYIEYSIIRPYKRTQILWKNTSILQNKRTTGGNRRSFFYFNSELSLCPRISSIRYTDPHQDKLFPQEPLTGGRLCTELDLSRAVCSSGIQVHGQISFVDIISAVCQFIYCHGIRALRHIVVLRRCAVQIRTRNIIRISEAVRYKGELIRRQRLWALQEIQHTDALILIKRIHTKSSDRESSDIERILHRSLRKCLQL